MIDENKLIEELEKLKQEINMPVDITDEINENVEVGTKVLVHK